MYIVLIRGLLHEWPAIQSYNRVTMAATFGHTNVSVSDIPYSDKVQCIYGIRYKV